MLCTIQVEMVLQFFCLSIFGEIYEMELLFSVPFIVWFSFAFEVRAVFYRYTAATAKQQQK